MFTNKQLIKFSIYAERVHRLAVDIAFSAAELGQYGQGMAIVADETRYIGMRLHSVFDNEIFKEEEIVDIVNELEYLSINGYLETMRLHESQLTLKKRLAVVFDEVRTASLDIANMFAISSEEASCYPKVSSAYTVLDRYFYYLVFKINGEMFIESVENIEEVLIYNNDFVNGDLFNLRNSELPLIKINPEKAKEYQTVIIVDTNYENEIKRYAVLVDKPPQIIASRMGTPAKPKFANGNIIRECWDCEEGVQLLFLDYTSAVRQ